MFYYTVVAARQNNTVHYTHTYTQIYPLKRSKKIKPAKKKRTDKTRAILLYCAGECVPYSLLYCLPSDANR